MKREIKDVLKNYSDEERELENKLHDSEYVRYEIKSRVNSMTHENDESTPNYNLNSEASLFRNRQFMKDLEKSKARLRTFSTFSPTDQELCDIAKFYRSLLTRAERTAKL
ncbi:uncharacterized protein LOC117174090 [Belonocnema kinseyi]|uniref:uncharacterized protein LOC117174090 n=1 Tax=Belonocnema kinseyi TaxID=2817044 RepID=UPI00143DC22B|nr:uncharacterized protein LOC117174090 [Belonocnema kinseyi]